MSDPITRDAHPVAQSGRVGALLVEGQQRALRAMAAGNTTESVLAEFVAPAAEGVGLYASIFAAVPKQGLRCLATSGLPSAIVSLMEECGGQASDSACAPSLASGERVILDDLSTAEYALERRIAGASDLLACWIQPIACRSTPPMGLFTLHFTGPATPHPADLGALETTAHLAAIMIERAQNLEAFDSSERLYHATFQDAPEALVVLDLDEGRFVDANARAIDLFKYTKDELLRLHPAAVSPPRQPDGTSSLEAAQAHVRRAAVDSSVTFDWVHKDATGRIFPCEVRLDRLKSSRHTLVRGLVKDLTADQKAEQDRARLIAILDATPDFVGIADHEGRALYVNPAGRKLVEVRPEEDVTQMSIEDFHPQDIAQRIMQQALPAAAQLGTWTGETVLQTRSGRTIPASQVVVAHKSVGGEVEFYSTIARDTTDRERAQQVLREREEQLRVALDAARKGAWSWDIKTGVVTWSDQVEPIFGLERGTLDGSYEAFRSLIHPDDVEELEAAYRRALDGGGRFDLQYRIVQPGGGVRWLEGKGRAYHDIDGRPLRIVGTLADITERKLVDLRLIRMQFSIDHAADAVFWNSLPDGRFIYVNDQACRSLQYTREELLSLTVPDVDPEFPSEALSELLDRLRRTRSAIIESRHRRKDGTTFPVELNLNYFEFNGEGFVSAFVRDVADRKQAEVERRKLEARVQQAQKLESLGILAGGVAHDFNNLLVGILGNTSMAVMDLPDDSPVRPMLQSIETAAMRAADLARQMLAYSGRGRFVIEALDLNSLVQEMSHLLDSSISKRTVIAFDLEPILPLVQGDATQLRQVVMNLITNASDALEDDAGLIRVSTGVAELEEHALRETYGGDALDPGRYVSLEVADQGCGMDTETLERIFDPFFTTKFIGRGLGLAAVLGIVRGHGGAIAVESQAGHGTTFRVLLPVQLEEDAVVGAESIEANDDIRSWRGTGTILVVDDEDAVRTVAGQILQLFGFEVETARDGIEALDILRQRAAEFSGVLLDMTMPRMSGDETFREIRTLRADLPVILSSGFNEEDTTRRFHGEGPAAYVQKPYRAEKLIRAFRGVLGDGGSSNQPAP